MRLILTLRLIGVALIFLQVRVIRGESATVRLSGLDAVVVDNHSWGEHKERYNGLALLSHRREFENVFHPQYGGFNLENIFDSEQEQPANSPQDKNFLFEPRNIPMRLRRISADTLELWQAAGPQWGIENRTRFKFREPFYVDIEFECIPRQKLARGGFVGLFWANYVNAPEDGGYYFLGRLAPGGELRWLRAFSQEHNNQSTFLPEESPVKTTFKPGYGSWLWSNFSSARYSYPFFYGIVKNQLFVLMFDNDKNIRFAHSPTGGGGTPAWDFQFIIPEYKVGKRYGIRARIVVKEFVNREDVIQEYERWSKNKVARPTP